jgi:hypothetical protein
LRPPGDENALTKPIEVVVEAWTGERRLAQTRAVSLGRF